MFILIYILIHVLYMYVATYSCTLPGYIIYLILDY